MKMTFFTLTLAFLLGFALILSSYGKEGGLVGYWKFDDEANLGRDSSEMGNHGATKGNAKWADGKFGGALSCDGSSGIEVPDSDSLSIKGDKVSIVIWANFAEVGNFYQHLITKNGLNKDMFAAYHLLVSRSGYIGGVFSFDAMTESGRALKPGCASNVAPEPNVWYHLAGVYNGKDQRIYINGKLAEGSEENDWDNPSPQSGNLIQSGEPLTIGFSTIHNFYSKGLFDEAAVFTGYESPPRFATGIENLGIQEWIKCALARTYARRFTPTLIEQLVEFLLDGGGKYAILNFR